jgi:two-component system nitrate/nitrite response regulator NarL
MPGEPARLRVLIVDDHERFRDLARRILTAARFDVVGEAADGAGALRQAAALRPDVVLLDVQLPDADGFVVARALTAVPDPPRVVLVSGRAPADYGALVRRSGACGFIGKVDLSGPLLLRTLAGEQ